MENLYEMREFIGDYSPELIIFLYVGFLILLVSFLIYKNRHKKLLERYNSLIGNFNGENLEELIIYLQNNVNDLNANVNTLKLDLEKINKELNFTIQNVGFIKYDAFDDIGNDMSYSLAILDKLKNGFVLTSIYGRNHNINYSKEIEEGISKKKLSAEEIIAVDRALKSQIEDRQVE